MLNQKDIIEHYERNWDTTDFYFITLEDGPMRKINNLFTIMVIPPNAAREMWTYATVGMSFTNNPKPIEIHLFSPTENDDLAEVLTAIAYYQTTEHKIHFGDTVNFGRPWLHNSNCSYGLISLPYLDGCNLEKLTTDDKTVSCYWLIPITEEERDYRWSAGLDELERLFDKSQFNYLDPFRVSIV